MSNPCIKDSRDSIGTVETRSRKIVEIRDDDFMIGKLMSSLPNSLSSKSFVFCPSKQNDRVQWEIIRSYDASFDENDFELIIRIGDYYWVLSWVYEVDSMLTDRHRSLTDQLIERQLIYYWRSSSTLRRMLSLSLVAWATLSWAVTAFENNTHTSWSVYKLQIVQ